MNSRVKKVLLQGLSKIHDSVEHLLAEADDLNDEAVDGIEEDNEVAMMQNKISDISHSLEEVLESVNSATSALDKARKI